MWWSPTKKQRAKMAKGCFLDAKNKKYVICPKGKKKPSCKGLLAARRRTILTGKRCGLEQKAIKLARKLKCPWAKESTAKCHGKRMHRSPFGGPVTVTIPASVLRAMRRKTRQIKKLKLGSVKSSGLKMGSFEAFKRWLRQRGR